MLVLDGIDGEGWSYDPDADAWEALPPWPLPYDEFSRFSASGLAAAWTGDRLVAWGGTRPSEMVACTDNWPLPPWLGSCDLPDAGPQTVAYDPSTGRWTVLPESPLARRAGATATWTGAQMIVVGGVDAIAASSGQPFDQDEPAAPAAALYLELAERG